MSRPQPRREGRIHDPKAREEVSQIFRIARDSVSHVLKAKDAGLVTISLEGDFITGKPEDIAEVLPPAVVHRLELSLLDRIERILLGGGDDV